MANTASRLFYRQPARAWTEALPLGNGRLGVMAFFGIQNERLALNEDTLWSGYPKRPAIKAPLEALKQARAALEHGDYAGAQAVIERDFTSSYSQAYLPLGDIEIMFDGGGDCARYERSLDMAAGVARCEFIINGAKHARECFVSAPNQAIVYRARTDDIRGINAYVRLKCPMRHALAVNGARIILDGECPGQARPSYTNDPNAIKYFDAPEKRGIRFKAVMDIILSGGGARAEADGVRVEGAQSLEIRLYARSSFAGYDKHPYLEGAEYERKCVEDARLSANTPYEALLDAHINEFGEWFKRVNFTLDKPENDDIPTDERLIRYQTNQNDPALIELMFNFGRYLMISASRPGTRATNLQGIWNESMRPPWSSNYTININTEMNYWPAESCALGEMHAPLFELVEAVRHTGGNTAREFYGARGVAAHHNTDIWGMSNPVGEGGKGCAIYAYWQMSYGWLCRHLFDHYLYTLDEAFLRARALPALKDAARFYLDIMVETDDGLAISPATSPENGFLIGGVKQAVARAATMCDAIVREVFESVLEAERILGEEDELALEIRAAVSKLRAFKIGGKGQLLEWDSEYEEPEPRHRHTSHLYALYPSHQITPDKTPALARACEQTLNMRGDDGTGWALGWKINFWARLGDGDHALKLLHNQLRFVPSVDNEKANYSGGGGTYTNLFDAHPPFQIDGNFALTAGVAEMLLRSEPETLYLLPALPSEWQSGEIKGLRAMNATRADIAFEGGCLKCAQLVCEKAPLKPFNVVYKGNTLLTIMRAGEYALKGSDIECC